MRVSSAKSKGRRLQKWVADKLVNLGRGLEPDDVRSASMGAPGEDILLSPQARKQFPMSIECKNVEKLSIWAAIEQARSNSRGYEPAVVFTRNHEETFITIRFDWFERLYEAYLNEKLNTD